MKRSWAATILAFVMALIGIVLAIGGAWLVSLGGSVYYLIAGVAMLVSAWLLFRGSLIGGWIYLGLFILSAIWGFSEARGNAWAMVPWLIAPLVLLIAVLLVMPTLTIARHRWKLAGGGILLGLVFVVASFVLLGAGGSDAIAALPAQNSPGMSDPSGLCDGRRLAGLWRDQCCLALYAAHSNHAGQCRKAAQGVGSPHRRNAQQPRLCEALRHGKYPAESRKPPLHLHRKKRHRGARRGDREAAMAGRSPRPRRLDPLYDGVPRRCLLQGPGSEPRTASVRPGSSKGRSTAG